MEEGQRSSDRPSRSDRIRDNQRRSRLRKKEYLQDLETRVRQYEADGVRAAAEIQVAARQVVENNKRYQEENQKLRQMLHNMGVSEAEIEDQLRLTTNIGSSRRGSTQTNAITTQMAATTMSMAVDQLVTLLGPQTSRIQMPRMLPRPDEDEDSEDEDDSPVRPPTVGSQRLSISLNPAPRSQDPLISPARHSDTTLLPTGPHSISSSAASTPSIERQTTTQDYPGTLPDPRASGQRQLVSPAQADVFGVPPVPSQTYTYGMPPQPQWGRQTEYSAPVTLYPTHTTSFVQSEAGSPINMLPPNILPTSVAYQESVTVPSTNNMGMHHMMPAPGQSSSSSSRSRRQPNIKSDPSLPDRWN